MTSVYCVFPVLLYSRWEYAWWYLLFCFIMTHWKHRNLSIQFMSPDHGNAHSYLISPESLSLEFDAITGWDTELPHMQKYILYVEEKMKWISGNQKEGCGWRWCRLKCYMHSKILYYIPYSGAHGYHLPSLLVAQWNHETVLTKEMWFKMLLTEARNEFLLIKPMGYWGCLP